MILFPILEDITQGQWFVSGSRGYGAWNDDSDLDICIPVWGNTPDIWKKLEDSNLTAKGLTPTASNYWSGSKIVLKSWPDDVPVRHPNHPKMYCLELNIIPLHPRSFISWAMTTTQMKVMWDDLKVKNNKVFMSKEMRVHQFEVRNSLNHMAFLDLTHDSQKELNNYSSIWNKLKGVVE